MTDLLRTFRQQPYRMGEHVHRFYESCKYARIPPPITEAETIEVMRELIRRNAALLPAGEELAVIYFITPGEHGSMRAKESHAQHIVDRFLRCYG